MPKVTKEYLDNKKKKIVEAAYQVCLRKTVSSVTMQDIIDESGFSQGGIYRFYSNIDEILVDLLYMVRSIPSIDLKVEKIFDGNPSVSDVTKQFFDLIVSHVKKNLFTYCKIDYEYNLFLTNYPDRAKKIYLSVTLPPIYDRLGKKLGELWLKEIDAGNLTPRVSISEIFQYLVVGYDGIMKRALYVSQYERKVNENADYTYKIDRIFHTFYLTTCFLLNIPSGE